MIIANLNSQLAIIAVSGSDAAKFLQGQLTNDINELEQQPWQFSAHLNNKGRMLASFIISKKDEAYYLITPAEIVDKIIQRLRMFSLRAQVKLARVEHLTIIFADCKMLTQINEAPYIELELQENSFLSLYQGIPAGSDKASPTTGITIWKHFLINNNIPFIYLNTQELFVPQQVNYDLLHGLNFKKGCYTGQEIVARTHYLGKIKRRLFQFSCKHHADIGQRIVSPIVDNQEVGVIVEIIKADDNYFGLVSLQTDCEHQAFLDKDNLLAIQIIAECAESGT